MKNQFYVTPISGRLRACRWFSNGDHYNDNALPISINDPALCEGAVVRYYRHPDCNGESICPTCGNTMHYHGFIDSGEGQTVCPGDIIIEKEDGYVAVHQKDFRDHWVNLPDGALSEGAGVDYSSAGGGGTTVISPFENKGDDNGI